MKDSISLPDMPSGKDTAAPSKIISEGVILTLCVSLKPGTSNFLSELSASQLAKIAAFAPPNPETVFTKTFFPPAETGLELSIYHHQPADSFGGHVAFSV